MKRIFVAVHWLLLAAIIVGHCVVPAHGGGHCGQFRRQVYAHHYAKVVAVQVQPYWLVGQPIRDDARDAKLVQRAIEAYAAQTGKFRGEGRFVIEGEVGVAAGGTVGGDTGTAPAPGGATYPDGAAALITRKCVSCHGPDNPKGGLDLTANIDRATASEIFLRTFSDDASIRMPPDGSLTDDERQVFFNLSESVLRASKQP